MDLQVLETRQEILSWR